MPPRWTPHWKPISHRERKENIQQYWTVLTSKLFYSLFSVSCSSLLTVWCVAFWLLAQKFFLSLYCLSRHAVLFSFFKKSYWLDSIKASIGNVSRGWPDISDVRQIFSFWYLCVCVFAVCGHLAYVWRNGAHRFHSPIHALFLAPTSEYILLTCWRVGAILSLWLFHYSSSSATASWVNIPTVNNSEQRPRFLEPCALTIETTSWTVEGNDWEEVWTASIGNTIIYTKEAGLGCVLHPKKSRWGLLKACAKPYMQFLSLSCCIHRIVMKGYIRFLFKRGKKNRRDGCWLFVPAVVAHLLSTVLGEKKKSQE
jgi:hypothetical protein